MGSATECEDCWPGWDKRSSCSSSYLYKRHWSFNKLLIHNTSSLLQCVPWDEFLMGIMGEKLLGTLFDPVSGQR